LIKKNGQYLTLHGLTSWTGQRDQIIVKPMTIWLQRLILWNIFSSERGKPIDESDVDSDGEIDSESTGIGNSINNKVYSRCTSKIAGQL
jgi:hypothetical protein